MDKETKRKFAKIISSIPLISRLYKIYNFRKVDVIINSFPKSGRTWLRVMLIRFLQLHYNLEKNPEIVTPMDLLKFNSKIPSIVFIHGNEHPFSKKPEELSDSTIGFRKKKFILLVRDPRDVIISTFFEKTRRGSNPSNFKGNISEFLKYKTGSFDTILRFYNIWYEKKSDFKDFLLVKYENLFKDPQGQLYRILNFIGKTDINEEHIEECVKFASFNNMQKMEREGTFLHSMLKPTDVKDKESYKTRKGELGGYTKYLSKNEIEYLDKKIRIGLSQWYGY